MNSKKILVVDDHQVVVMGILHMFRNHNINVNVSDVSDLADAHKLLTEQLFDLIILDINVPGGNKPSMVEALRRIQPKANILIYSGCDESLYAYPYLQAGANGFLSKNSSEKEFILAYNKVINGEQYMGPLIFQQVIGKVVGGSHIGMQSLTSREIEILQCLMKGASVTKIGEDLSLHVSTVSTHKTRIFSKLGVSNLAEMIDYVKLNVGPEGVIAG